MDRMRSVRQWMESIAVAMTALAGEFQSLSYILQTESDLPLLSEPLEGRIQEIGFPLVWGQFVWIFCWYGRKVYRLGSTCPAQFPIPCTHLQEIPLPASLPKPSILITLDHTDSDRTWADLEQLRSAGWAVVTAGLHEASSMWRKFPYAWPGSSVALPGAPSGVNHAQRLCCEGPVEVGKKDRVRGWKGDRRWNIFLVIYHFCMAAVSPRFLGMCPEPSWSKSPARINNSLSNPTTIIPTFSM